MHELQNTLDELKSTLDDIRGEIARVRHIIAEAPRLVARGYRNYESSPGHKSAAGLAGYLRSYLEQRLGVSGIDVEITRE